MPELTEGLRAALERLKACVDDLECNARNLKADSFPGEPDFEMCQRIADERLQWAADLRLVLTAAAPPAVEDEGAG
jgi:hypothetical protein